MADGPAPTATCAADAGRGARTFEDAGEQAREQRARAGRRLWPRGDAGFLAGWTAGAFALRLLLLFGVEHVISPDGVRYAALARALAAGDLAGGLSTYWPPLYPALVAAASLALADVELAGRLVSVVAGSLLVLPVYKLARDSYGREVARLAAALAALHPLLVYYSTVMLTEAAYTLLFACGVAAGWAALGRAGAGRFLLAGVAFGACYLLKPESAGFVLLLAALGLAARLSGARRASPKDSLAGAAALAAGFLLLALPYLLYLRRETGAWTLSGKLAGHMWQGSRRAGDSIPGGAGLMPDATTAVVQLTKALRHEYEVLNLIFPVVFVMLAALGLFASRWTLRRARREIYMLAFVAATLAGYAVTLPNIRFFVPLIPLALCWVAKGVLEFERWAGGTARRAGAAHAFTRAVSRAARPLVVALLIASLLPLSAYLLRGDKWDDYHGQKRAALWIRAREGVGREPVIMSAVPVPAFYAGGRHVALADEGYAEFVARARSERVDYVVVDERTVKLTRLRDLLDVGQAPPELRLVHSLAESPAHRIFVYTLAER